MRLLQLLLLGVPAVVLIGVVARRLAGRGPAVAAMAIAVVFPSLLAYQGTLLSEALLVPVLLGAVAAVLRFRDEPRARWLIVAGVLAGLMVLTRWNAVVLVPVLAAAAAGAAPRRLPAAGAVVLVAALTVVPWTVRNALVVDAFVPVSTQTGYTLAGTYNDLSRTNEELPGAWIDPGFFAERAPRALGGDYAAILGRGLDEPRLDAALRREALAYMGDHPAYPVRVVAANAARVLGLTGTAWEERSAATSGIAPQPAALSAYGFLAVLVLAVAALATRRARRLGALVWLGAALLALSFLVSQGETRHRVPLDPLAIVLAGTAVAAAPAWWSRRRAVLS